MISKRKIKQWGSWREDEQLARANEWRAECLLKNMMCHGVHGRPRVSKCVYTIADRSNVTDKLKRQRHGLPGEQYKNEKSRVI